MKGVVRTPLRRIATEGGDVMHALKSTEPTFEGIGEVYFTFVDHHFVKGWKRHRFMVMNLVVAIGSVRFVLVDEADGSSEAFDLSANDASMYARLTVYPGLWMAFGGLSQGTNLIVNMASIEHDPLEADRAPLERFAWDWGLSASSGRRE